MMKEPEKILKKQLVNGANRFQVKWKGFEEPTWETEDNVKKYKELIEDFNYFCLTGERYDDKKLDEIKQMVVLAQPRTAIKRVSGPKPPEVSKKEKRVEKVDQKLDQKYSEEQPEPVIVQHDYYTNQHQQNHKISQLIGQKQQELAQKVVQHYATSEDKLKAIKLQIADETCLFEFQWYPRADGITPLSELYSYDNFKLVAPLFYIQFIETCLLECEQSSGDISFIAQGNDINERATLLKNILKKRDDEARRKQPDQQIVV